MPTVKEVSEYKTIRQWLMAEFRARPRTIITMNDLLARQSGWTPRQIRASIANLRHEKRDQFPLRVAAFEPRANGRPGSPTGIAWIYEPRHAEVPLPEPDPEVDDEPDTDTEDAPEEGYRWTPLATQHGQVIVSGGGRVPGLVDLPGELSNGRRTYEELATTKAGAMLVEDEDGEVYRLVKL